MTTLLHEKPQLLPPEQQEARWIALLAKLGPLIGLIFVLALFSILAPSRFPRVSNFELILRQTAVVGTAALGMTLIIIAGGIDLSVGSAIALCVVTIALLLKQNVPPAAAALGGIAAGTLCGMLIGLLITRLQLPPFIITLGMFGALRGGAEQLADNSMVYPPAATWLNELMRPINSTHLWLLTPGAWMMIVLAIFIALVLRYTRFGRHIFAIGSNEQTARLCGVHVERTKLLIYMLGATFAGLAGVLQFSYLTMGDPTTAMGMELDIIAAVVIGGASLNGGQGTILGSLVGALIMSIVANGCTKLEMGNPVQKMVTGGIIVLAVAMDRLRQRRS